MRISIRNNVNLPKKYLRFIKWKFFSMKEKFDELLYVEIFLNSEGQSPKTYSANIRLGVPGNDIIIQHKSKEWGEIFRKTTTAVHRSLDKMKKKKQRA